MSLPTWKSQFRSTTCPRLRLPGARGHLDGELPWGMTWRPGFRIPLNRMALIDPVTGITLLSTIVKIVIVNTAKETVPS